MATRTEPLPENVVRFPKRTRRRRSMLVTSTVGELYDAAEAMDPDSVFDTALYHLQRAHELHEVPGRVGDALASLVMAGALLDREIFQIQQILPKRSYTIMGGIE